MIQKSDQEAKLKEENNQKIAQLQTELDRIQNQISYFEESIGNLTQYKDFVLNLAVTRLSRTSSSIWCRPNKARSRTPVPTTSSSPTSPATSRKSPSGVPLRSSSS